MIEAGIHLLDDFLDGLFDEREEWLRVDADPECQNNERDETNHFAETQIGQMLVRGIGDGTEHDALVQPQQVSCAENDAERAPGGPGLADLKRALENGELSDETVQERHSERAEADDEIDRGKIRHRGGQTAELGNHARVPAFVEHADNQEERAGGDAVINLLKDAAGEAVGRERENSEGAKSQMTDGTVGDEALHVFLHEADERAVDDADQREHDDDLDDARAHGPFAGQERQRETDEAVGAHFQQDAGQNDGAGRGRFRVRVGNPGVEREHGHFDGEGEEEAPEEPDFQWIGEFLRSIEQSGNIKRAHRARRNRRVEVQRQNGEQHDYRTRQGVQEKFDGGVETAVASPDADEEVHGNKHHFPENVKEEKVERGEHADHAGLQEQQQNVVFLGARVDGAPGRKDGDHAAEGGEHDEEQADAVNAEVRAPTDGGNPREVFLEREPGRAGVPPADQGNRNEKT